MWRPTKQHAQFRRRLPQQGLEITKTYRLAKVPAASLADGNYPAYHLEFEIEIRNVGSQAHKVAYRLDGPNGLPTEGKWYATRVTRSGGSGLRDFIISFGGGTPGMVGAMSLAADKVPATPWSDEPDSPLTFVGVDAQYFSALLMPKRTDPQDVWFEELQPIRVGKADPQHTNLTNTSCRLIGRVRAAETGRRVDEPLQTLRRPEKTLRPGERRVPAGRAGLFRLADLRLGRRAADGDPARFLCGRRQLWNRHHPVDGVDPRLHVPAEPQADARHAENAAVAAGDQEDPGKVQEQHRGPNQSPAELFRKHNYNPLAGCLPIFIQMPVFIGLYRSLMVAIELRDAPLIVPSIRWCSNLAAPDMLYDWSWFMPAFVNSGGGIFGLGPYFNLLPILASGLILWQQKMFTPPPADEQAAMQQKVMQYMMIFMGLMFFKVASGLCIYFIAQSVWGVAERKFLPKPLPVAAGGMETRAQAKAQARKVADAAAREEAAQAKKSRGKK